MIVKHFQEVEPKVSPDSPGVEVRWVLGKPDGAPRFAMRVIEVAPGHATPRHQHWWEHEVFVLEGEGVAWSRAGERVLRPGVAVYVPGNEEHQFLNTGTGPLRFICVIPHTESGS